MQNQEVKPRQLGEADIQVHAAWMEALIQYQLHEGSKNGIMTHYKKFELKWKDKKMRKKGIKDTNIIDTPGIVGNLLIMD